MAKHYFYPPDLKLIERECRTCMLLLPISQYSLNQTHTSGYNTQCRACFKKVEAERYKVKSAEIKLQVNAYVKNNRPKRRAACNKRQRARLKEDPTYKLSRNLRNRLYYLLLENPDITKLKYKNYVGCSGEYLKQHLEIRFDSYMNWDNYGVYWEVDHIRPLSKFTSIDDLYARCHFTNLQPLKIEENRAKSDKENGA